MAGAAKTDRVTLFAERLSLVLRCAGDHDALFLRADQAGADVELIALPVSSASLSWPSRAIIPCFLPRPALLVAITLWPPLDDPAAKPGDGQMAARFGGKP